MSAGGDNRPAQPAAPRSGDEPGGAQEAGPTLRAARTTDARRLSEIARTAKAQWGYPAAWLAGWRNQLRITPGVISRDRAVIAVLNDAIVGFSVLNADDVLMHIEHLWVVPPAMGRAIGRRLVADAVAWCVSRDVTRLRVVSDPHAAGFYRRLGGVEIGDVASTPAPRRLPVLEFTLSASGVPVTAE